MSDSFGINLEGGGSVIADEKPLNRPELAAVLRETANFFGNPEIQSTVYPFTFPEGNVAVAPPITVIGMISAIARQRGIEVAATRSAVAKLLHWDAEPRRGLGEGNEARPGAYIYIALLHEAARFTPSTL